MFVVTLTAILIPFLYKEYCGNYVPLIIFPVAGIIMASFTFFMLLGILTIIVLMLPKNKLVNHQYLMVVFLCVAWLN